MRRVRGVLFRDYTRMLRAVKNAPYRDDLASEDLAYLDTRIDPSGWYPMATFERLGNAILRHVARGEMFPVQLWGRYSAAPLRDAFPVLVVPGEPVATLRAFDALRETFFDFDPIRVAMVVAGEAKVTICYHMGMPAEEAASHQTMGFFEGLLQLAGATDIDAVFRERSWAGHEHTLVALRWRGLRHAR
jgi:hypothetical protein